MSKCLLSVILGGLELIFRQEVNSVQVTSWSMVSLPASELVGSVTGRWEKLAIATKNYVGEEEAITPSISITLSEVLERKV